MQNLYAIRDRIARALVGNSMYLIFAFRNDGLAIRYFGDAIMDEKSILNRHATDYELVCLGELHDSEDGEVIHAATVGSHRLVITGDAILNLVNRNSNGTPELVKEA